MTKYLTYRQIGEHLGLTQSGARKWVETRGLPRKWRGKCWVVAERVVERALDGQPVQAEPDHRAA